MTKRLLATLDHKPKEEAPSADPAQVVAWLRHRHEPSRVHSKSR